MTAKPVVLRSAAVRVIESAVDEHHRTGGHGVATELIAGFAEACSHLARHSQSGSPAYGHDLQIPGLRTWTLERFPYLVFYLVFYLDQRHQVDVLRVLHQRQDVPASLRREP